MAGGYLRIAAVPHLNSRKNADAKIDTLLISDGERLVA
jgi:hypothetical protein